MIIPLLDGDIREASTAMLAYIGDGVFDLYIRLQMVGQNVSRPKALHQHTSRYVRAASQAAAARVLFAEMSEVEQSIFRRAKNSNPGSMAKNASPADYKYATGLEALIGYLYLTDQKLRLDYLLQRIFMVQTGIEKGEINPYEAKEKDLSD